MKTFLLTAILAFSATVAQAMPHVITCDDTGPLGLSKLKRVDFIKQQGNQYLMQVYQEKQGKCCRYLVKKGEGLVDLVESQNDLGTVATPANETNIDVRLDFAKKKCRIKGVDLNIKGKIIL